MFHWNVNIKDEGTNQKYKFALKLMINLDVYESTLVNTYILIIWYISK